jgi:hypothetical protein
VSDKIRALIAELEKERASNAYISEHGSAVTSMAEDICLGFVADEQKRIIARLKEILES